MERLDDIHRLFSCFAEAIRIARLFIKNPTQPIDQTKLREDMFLGKTLEVSQELLNKLENEINEVLVLALTAKFERIIRDGLFDMATELGTNITERRLGRKLAEEIETWKLSSNALDFFNAVSGNLKGQAKQVVDFRNWVAHGHKYGTAPETPTCNVTPIFAYQTLNEFLEQSSI